MYSATLVCTSGIFEPHSVGPNDTIPYCLFLMATGPPANHFDYKKFEVFKVHWALFFSLQLCGYLSYLWIIVGHFKSFWFEFLLTF